MVYSGCIIFIESENLAAVSEILGTFEEIDIHGVSEDKKQIVISVETEDDTALEELGNKLKSYDQIIDIGYHIMHFEEEVDAMLKGEKTPQLKGFQRSKRREIHPLEEA